MTGVEETILHLTDGDAEAQRKGYPVQDRTLKDCPNFWLLVLCFLWCTSLCIYERGFYTHWKRHNPCKSHAHWQLSLPGVRTNEKRRTENPRWNLAEERSGLEESKRIIPGHERDPTKAPEGGNSKQNCFAERKNVLESVVGFGFVFLPWGQILRLL